MHPESSFSNRFCRLFDDYVSFFIRCEPGVSPSSSGTGNIALAPSQQSFRRLKRENTILEAIRTWKVIEDPAKLHQLIKQQEAEDPKENDGVMDRKSLHRILGRLAADNQIKTINIKLTLPPR